MNKIDFGGLDDSDNTESDVIYCLDAELTDGGDELRATYSAVLQFLDLSLNQN